MAGLSFDEALEAVAVYECNDMNRACGAAGFGTPHPPDWRAVVTDVDGAVAYFSDKLMALEHRLALVGALCKAGYPRSKPVRCLDAKAKGSRPLALRRVDVNPRRIKP